MKEFTYLHNECLQRLQKFSSLATGLGSVSSAILHYETFRTKTQESLAADSTFIQVNYLPSCNVGNPINYIFPILLQLLSQCQDVCLLKDCGTNGRLTEAEVRLAQRITLGEHGATEDWINQTEKSISGVFEIL